MTARRRKISRLKSTTLLSRRALCTLLGISEDELALWEHEELIVATVFDDARGSGEPLYDESAIKRARLIRTLAEELGVNLAGIGVILDLLDRLGR